MDNKKGGIGMYNEDIKRGDILLVNFGSNRMGSLQCGIRYSLCLSNDQNNCYSSVIQVAPFTSQTKTRLPVHIEMEANWGLKKVSTLLLEQLTVISKMQIIRKIGHIDSEEMMNEVDKRLKIQLGL